MFTIKNKLEIFPSGNGGIIHIPGSEPTSNHSSLTLVNQLKANGRNKPYISLKKALELVPGSTVERWSNSAGQRGVPVMFFVLPDGPPRYDGCPNRAPFPQGGLEDGGEILFEDGTPIEFEEEDPIPCSVNDWYTLLAENADGILKPEQKGPSLDELCSMFTYRHGNSEIF